MNPSVHVPVVVDGARAGNDSIPSGVVPLSSLAPTNVSEGEVVWMSRIRDYRIQLKGQPKRVVGDQILPEVPRFAQFEGYIFRSSDDETNRQMRASKACGVDFWDSSDLAQRRKEAEVKAAVEAVERVMAMGDQEAQAALTVLLGQKELPLPPRKPGRPKADSAE